MTTLPMCIGSLVSWINKAYARGSVALQSPDPAPAPLVEFNFLADPRDAARFEHASPSRYTGLAKSLGRRSLRNLSLACPTALRANSNIPVPIAEEFAGRIAKAL